jgi:hypothetical protein
LIHKVLVVGICEGSLTGTRKGCPYISCGLLAVIRKGCPYITHGRGVHVFERACLAGDGDDLGASSNQSGEYLGIDYLGLRSLIL